MKRNLFFLFLLSLLLFSCTTAQPTQSPPPTQIPPTPFPDTPAPPAINAALVESPALVFIQFISELNGWGVTETQIVRTNDGGVTWYNVTPMDLTETGYSVEMFILDNDHVWIHKPDMTNYPNNGFLYRTSDGGMTWTNSNTPFSGGDIQFLDATHGWALADLGVAAGSHAVAIYQTSDGGASWTQTFTNDPNNLNASESLPLGGLKAGIAAVNMQTAWIYGVVYYSGVINLFRTDDGGVNWISVDLPLPSGAENFELSIDQGQMKFVSPNDGFIVMRFSGNAYQLAVYVTRDGGNTWTLTPTLIPNAGSANFMSAQEMVIYNGEQFYVTRDAANTWSIVPPDVKFGETFAGMSFANPNVGWVTTLDPNNHRSLYKSDDGGTTWFPIVP